jgi:hypothetical protein
MRRFHSIRSFLLAAAGLAMFGAFAEPAEARPGWREGIGQSFDADRPAERSREVSPDRQRTPLYAVVQRLERRVGGQMLDARVVKGGRGEMYVIKWLTEDGRKIEFLVDAVSGAVLDQRGG